MMAKVITDNVSKIAAYGRRKGVLAVASVTPILIYAGQAKHAIDLYKRAFNAQVQVLMRCSDANPKDFQYREEDKDLIYHSQVKIGKQTLIIADAPATVLQADATGQPSKPFFIDLVVTFDTDNELMAAYDVLSDGGTIREPLCSQTYCSLCVSLVDRHGGQWQLMSGFKG